MDWRIHHQYTVAPSPQDDICWTKFHGDDSDAVELEDSDTVDPIKAYVIFKQPYNMDTAWVSDGSEMFVTETILSKTPKRTLVAGDDDVLQLDDRPMLESMDVGYRGMSGAIAVNENGKFVGMFVKRGNLISSKLPRMVTAEDTSAKYEDTSAKYEDTSAKYEDKVEDTVESMGFETIPPALPSSWIEQLLFPSRSAHIARMDAHFRHLNDQFNAQFRHFYAQLRNHTDIVLKKEDLSLISPEWTPSFVTSTTSFGILLISYSRRRIFCPSSVWNSTIAVDYFCHQQTFYPLTTRSPFQLRPSLAQRRQMYLACSCNFKGNNKTCFLQIFKCLLKKQL